MFDTVTRDRTYWEAVFSTMTAEEIRAMYGDDFDQWTLEPVKAATAQENSRHGMTGIDSSTDATLTIGGGS